MSDTDQDHPHDGLVERLEARALDLGHEGLSALPLVTILREAAAEIVRLRAALAAGEGA